MQANEEIKQIPHTLWTNKDPNPPRAICDQHGEVALALCKVCGQGECDLEASCPGPAYRETNADCGEGESGFANAQNHDRAELGIDGSHAFALLGADLQSGEAEFVEITSVLILSCGSRASAEISAAKTALENLRFRLESPELSYFFGPSHPYGN